MKLSTIFSLLIRIYFKATKLGKVELNGNRKEQRERSNLIEKLYSIFLWLHLKQPNGVC